MVGHDGWPRWVATEILLDQQALVFFLPVQAIHLDNDIIPSYGDSTMVSHFQQHRRDRMGICHYFTVRQWGLTLAFIKDVFPAAAG